MTSASAAKKKVVVSGMRPTGKLHLGHYFGALTGWKRLQDAGSTCYFFSADWHALTTHYNEVAPLAAHRIEMVADWLACGIDPEQSVIFFQSQVPQHAELSTLLGMLVPVPWLERVPSYKEVKQQLADRDLSTVGFLSYPLLQTADIVLYKADAVPVGEDQLPHVELSREVVRRFNHLYAKKNKSILIPPQGVLHDNAASARLPGVDGRKMSKSYDNAVYLCDSAKVVDKKIKRAMTDPARVRREDPGDPDKCPMYQYQLLFHGEETLQLIRHNCSTAGWGCIDCKMRLLEPLQQLLEPIRAKRQQLLEKPDQLLEIAIRGGEKARQRAELTMSEVRSAMGLA